MNQHDASHFIPIIFFAVAQVIFGNIPFMLKMKSYSKFLLVVLNLFLVVAAAVDVFAYAVVPFSPSALSFSPFHCFADTHSHFHSPLDVVFSLYSFIAFITPTRHC